MQPRPGQDETNSILPALFKRGPVCPPEYICPKCKKKGHYYFECKKDAVYRKRVSATQKLAQRYKPIENEATRKAKRREKVEKIKQMKEKKQQQLLAQEEENTEMAENTEQINKNNDGADNEENNIIYTGLLDPAYQESNGTASESEEDVGPQNQ